jgi:hypothetical protein
MMLYDFTLAGQSNGHALVRQVWIKKPRKTRDRVLRAIVILNEMHGRDCSKVPLTVTHEELALIVDADRASVSACLKRLEGEGLIKLGYRKIWLSAALASEHLEVMVSREFEDSFIYPRFSDLSVRDDQRLLIPLSLSGFAIKP